MPTAVISDIHGNAVALRAVLAEIAACGIDKIVCLGISWVTAPILLNASTSGCASASGRSWVLLRLRRALRTDELQPGCRVGGIWTRDQFHKEPDSKLGAERYEFLNRLRVGVVEYIGEGGIQFAKAPIAAAASAASTPITATGVATMEGKGLIPLLAVHGSPRRPINEYIFPDDAMNSPDKMEAVFDRVQRVAIVGHTLMFRESSPTSPISIRQRAG